MLAHATTIGSALSIREIVHALADELPEATGHYGHIAGTCLCPALRAQYIAAAEPLENVEV